MQLPLLTLLAIGATFGAYKFIEHVRESVPSPCFCAKDKPNCEDRHFKASQDRPVMCGLRDDNASCCVVFRGE